MTAQTTSVDMKEKSGLLAQQLREDCSARANTPLSLTSTPERLRAAANPSIRPNRTRSRAARGARRRRVGRHRRRARSVGAGVAKYL